MSESMAPEIADAIAGIHAAGLKRSYDKGYADGFMAGAVAQRDLMLKNAAKEAEDKPQEPTTVILVDEGGIERIRDRMDNPDA